MSSRDSLEALYESKDRNEKFYEKENPSAGVLETFDAPSTEMIVTVNCPEFTSLCPVTGQPDFARIHIIYVPLLRCVESKSLKLYLMRYRNHGDFHEACVQRIATDLSIAMNIPRYLRVFGDFTPRGGLAIKPVEVRENSDHKISSELRQDVLTVAQRYM